MSNLARHPTSLPAALTSIHDPSICIGFLKSLLHPTAVDSPRRQPRQIQAVRVRPGSTLQTAGAFISKGREGPQLAKLEYSP